MAAYLGINQFRIMHLLKGWTDKSDIDFEIKMVP